jgi:hypothetical protein
MRATANTCRVKVDLELTQGAIDEKRWNPLFNKGLGRIKDVIATTIEGDG